MKLEIENLSKSWNQNKVLDGINFTFEEGKIYGLIGRNGAGKTTLFNCLNDDIEVDTGRFYLEDMYGRNKLQTKDIGYVLSTPVVPEFLTAKEFLSFFLEINKESTNNKKSIDEYFKLVGIEKKDQEKLLKEYSHGMKNKIQILINIITNPKIILLDEPLTSLDIVIQDEMKKLLKSLKKDHIIILSTHILELALDLCDSIVILNHYKLESIEKNNLNTKKYKDKIIESLKDDSND